MLAVAYGEDTLDKSNVYRWYKILSEDREDVNDEGRSVRPSTSTTDETNDEVKKIILANPRISDFLAKNNKVMIPQPSYSPDLASCNFLFFSNLKRPMKRRLRYD